MLLYTKFKDWAIAQHSQTNHMYDGKLGDPIALPYSYHLKLVTDVIIKFERLIDYLHEHDPKAHPRFEIILMAAWGHDLIEDARVTYNDVVKAVQLFGYSKQDAIAVAEIIRAVTNVGRGRNRAERMPDFVYQEIFATPGAVIVKCADRAGNLKHGLISGSSQKDMYRAENQHFEKMLYSDEFTEMFEYIQKLIDTEI